REPSRFTAYRPKRSSSDRSSAYENGGSKTAALGFVVAVASLALVFQSALKALDAPLHRPD
ncbi:MAG: hypothetical protein V3U93_06795, partial [Alphaproteobacteria bacterium]